MSIWRKIETEEQLYSKNIKYGFNLLDKICPFTRSPKIVEHHVKYIEIHGKDVTTFILQSEHIKLHRRLRKTGKCNIPIEILDKISTTASKRTKKAKRDYKLYELLKRPFSYFIEVTVICWFVDFIDNIDEPIKPNYKTSINRVKEIMRLLSETN